jgi:hypothetical protein
MFKNKLAKMFRRLAERLEEPEVKSTEETTTTSKKVPPANINTHMPGPIVRPVEYYGPNTYI